MDLINCLNLEKNKKFKTSSFPTISGTGPNGAIIHYKATKKTNRVLKKGDIYLVELRWAIQLWHN